MAKIFELDKNKSEVLKILQKSVQSCNINFLIGSGCSYPALDVLGSIEQEVEKLYKEKKEEEANEKMVAFLMPFSSSTKQLTDNKPDDNHKETLENYNNFLKAISLILFERKSNILHKQVSIFSTNYDMFIEKAVELYADTIILNDGFCRNPSLTNDYCLSTRAFFNTVSNTGNLYKYQVEIPSINLIKLHGSMNWQIRNGKIYQSLDKNFVKKDDFIDQFSVILPTKEKLKETCINQIYYDLLRIFSNELDKENILLITEGFSFADEHIFDITKRALKNPTLLLVIFCYQKSELAEFEAKFTSFNNVHIIYSENENVDFARFNAILSELLPKREEKPIYTVEIKEPKDE